MVKLHRITMWVVDPDGTDDAVEQVRDALDSRGSPIISSITEIRTAEFDREWDDDDPLNSTENLDDHAFMENMLEKGQE